MGFNFNDLFVFDLANNHQGDVAHARGIIEAVGGVVKQRGVRGVFKFGQLSMDITELPS